MEVYNDRIVSVQWDGQVKMIVFPRAFEGAPYLYYLLGPFISSSYLGSIVPNVRSMQSLIGTAPTWRFVCNIVRVVMQQVNFVAEVDGAMLPLTLDFSSFPRTNLFPEFGNGWVDLSSEVGHPMAVRQSPVELFRPDSRSLGYSVAGVANPDADPNRVAYVSHGFSPCCPDAFLPEFDYKTIVERLRDIEAKHAAGFF